MVSLPLLHASVARAFARATLLVCIVAAGCAPADPEPALLGGAVSATVEPLLAGDEQELVFAYGLSDWSVIAASSQGLWQVELLDPEPQALGTASGDVLSALDLPSGDVLLSTSDGLWVYRQGELLASPWQEGLPFSTADMTMPPDGDGGELWFASSEELYLFRNGQLQQVRAGGRALSGASMAWATGLDGTGWALWILSDGRLFVLDLEGDVMEVAQVRDDLQPDALVADARGEVWLAVEGDLHHRSAEGTWSWLSFPEPVVDLSARSRSGSMWVHTDGGLWHRSTGRFQRVEGVPAGEFLGLDRGGRILLFADDALVRVAAGRSVLLLGLDEGQQLDVASLLTVLPAQPEQVTELVATLDGAEVAVPSEPPFEFTIDPLDLEDGPHELEVVARYGEEEYANGLFFSVGVFKPAAWNLDIEPLFERSCTPCHRDEGGARLLTTAEAWRADIDLIINSVVNGDMPLNSDINPNVTALTPEEIQQIRSWAAGGFPE